MATERRQLGLAATVAVVTGESIALGIFLTPASMAKALGSPLLLGLVWLGVALMAMCGALCYSELAIRFPESGGEYVYLHAGYGERLAFLYGWMSSIVMYPGVAAALAVGSVPYMAQLMPLSTTSEALLPVVLLCGFAVLNLLGTGLSGVVLSTINVLKFATLFTLVAWAAFSGHAHVSNLLPVAQRRPGSEPLFGAVAGAAIAAFFSFGGWWEASKIAGAVRNPRRTVPMAFTIGVALVTLVYLLISAAFLAVLPIRELTSNTAFVAQFGGVLFGSAGARVLSICVLACVCGGIAALTMAARASATQWPALDRSSLSLVVRIHAFERPQPLFCCRRRSPLPSCCLALSIASSPISSLHGDFLGPDSLNALPFAGAGLRMVVPSRAYRLHRVVHSCGAIDSRARSVACARWHSHRALRITAPATLPFNRDELAFGRGRKLELH